MRKLTALIAAAAICTSCTAYSADTLTENSAEVSSMATAGILNGTENGYELERAVTRAETLTFIERLLSPVFPDIDHTEPLFSDTEGHWAYDTIEKFGRAGYVEGTGSGAYEPDRNVTAREFTKIFLSAENGGSAGITIDNVYDAAVSAGYLNNDTVRELVAENTTLTRSDAIRLCYDFYYNTDHPVSDVFTAKLTAAMPQNENYMISPLSIKTAFAMLANGAEGETRAQLISALEIDDLDTFNNDLMLNIKRYSEDEVSEIDISNSLWLFEDLTDRNFLDAYVDTANKYYNAETFRMPSSDALESMNGWVSEKTHEKIDQIMSEDEFNAVLSEGLFSVLINTVYFKTAWQNQFTPQSTYRSVFTDRNGKETETDFMLDVSYYDYCDNGSMQIIRMPYSTHRNDKDSELHLSMYAIKGNYSYAAAEKAINDGLGTERVELSFPKFKTEYEMPVLDIIKDFGAINVTSPALAGLGAMYSGDTGPGASNNPYVSYATHKTYIEVNEEGTEAAAVTGIGVGGSNAITEPPINVKYDTPFMYIIRDDDTGETLFVGEYAFVD